MTKEKKSTRDKEKSSKRKIRSEDQKNRLEESFLDDVREILEAVDIGSVAPDSLDALSLDLFQNRSDPVPFCVILSKIEGLLTQDPSEDFKKSILSKGVLKIVVGMMASELESALVQACGCRFLASMVLDFKLGQEQVFLAEGPFAVLDTMKQFPDELDVQLQALIAVKNLTYHDPSRKLLVTNNAIELCVSSMVTIIDPTVHELASTVMSNLSFGNPERKHRVGTSGGIKAMIDSVTKFPSLLSVANRTCRALRNLTWGCPENQSLVVEQGGITMILEVTRKFQDAELHENAIGALANICLDHLENCRRLLKLDGLSAILHEMEFLKSQETIQEHCCSVLFSLTKDCPEKFQKWIDEEWAARLCSLICESISLFPKSSGTLQKGCGLIQNLGNTEEQRLFLGRNGILAVLSSALRNSADLVTMEPVIVCMNLLVSGVDENKEAVGKYGAIEGIISNLARSETATATMEVVCMLLDNLVDGCDLNTEHCINSNVFEPLLKVMTTSQFSAKIQEHSFSILVKIASVEPNTVPTLQALDTTKIVQSGLKAHSGSPAVESLANQLLSILIWDPSSRNGRSQTAGRTGGNSARSRSRVATSGSTRSRSRNSAKSKTPPKIRTGTTGLDTIAE